MFGSSTLDVAIGLVFVILLTSLVCTAVNELVAALTRARARFLVEGVRSMLSEGTSTGAAYNWAGRFFEHGLIKGLSRRGGAPSYIPSQTFALVLVDLVARYREDANRMETQERDRQGGGVAQALDPEGMFRKLREAVEDINESDVRDVLRLLILEGMNDVSGVGSQLRRVEDQIEIWFNEAMERVSGWYKRKTQYVILLIALVVTTSLNIDAIQIARALAQDSMLRASVRAMAERYVQQPPVVLASGSGVPPTTQTTMDDWKRATQNVQESVSSLRGVGIPIGWTDANPWHWEPGWIALKLSGILLAAIAASLGAPFWFDTLNRIMSIRAAGKDPGERQREPGRVPGPRRPEDTPTLRKG